MRGIRPTLAAVAIACLTCLQSNAQKIETASPTHPDDLVTGPQKVTIHVRADREAKPEPKEATLLFLTKSKFVYLDKEGRKVIRSDGLYVTKVIGADPKNEWEWDEKAKAFTGPAIPPPPIQVISDKLSKNQMSGYLAVRAEFLHLELENAITRKDKIKIENILRYAGFIKDYARQQGLSTGVIGLFELQEHINAQTALLKELADQFVALHKQKINAAQSLAAVRRSFQAQAIVATLHLVAAGVAPPSSITDSGDQKFEYVLGALGELGQAVANRDLDDRMLKDTLALYDEKTLTAVNRIQNQLKVNRTKLTERPKEVWESLGIQEDTLHRLDSLVGSLLEKRDLAAALVILDDRVRYLKAKGFQSPQLMALINTLKAYDLARKPQNAADRAERSQKIFKLSEEVIASARMVPDEPVFLPDRLQILAIGGKLAHLSVAFSQDPRAGNPLSESWDLRADYGARALSLAATHDGTVSDPSGAARATRALLLFERGLHREAMEEARKLEDLVGIDSAALVNLARFYSRTGNPKEAAAALQKAFKAGYRDTRSVEIDPDLQPMWTNQRNNKGDLWKYREVPEVDAFLDLNPLTAANSFPSYSLEIKNKTAYPVTNIKVKFFGKFLQNRKDVEVSSQELTIDFLGPVGTGSDTFFWPDAFKASGAHRESNLRVISDRKSVGGRTIQGTVRVQAAQRTFFRPYWWYYHPDWYYGF